MNELTFTGYEDYKKTLDNAMGTAVENFVLIGYLLRQAKENPELLEETEYEDYKAFAKSEYGLEASQVSRFISINERYGAGADLLPQYKGYGQSKLAEMLSLPKSIADEISPDTTREEIRDIKKAVAEEKSVSPVERFLEGNGEEDDAGKMENFFSSFFENNKDAWIALKGWDKEDIEVLSDAIYPNGEGLIRGKIKGEGNCLLKSKGVYDDLKLTVIRDGSSRNVEWPEITEGLRLLLVANEIKDFTSSAWEKIYGKEEIAPAQDKENKPKEEQKANETEPSEEQETTSDKGNKPITDEESRPIEAETDQDTGMVVADQEAETVAEDIEAEAKEVDEKEEQTIEADEDKEENEQSVMDLFGYVRNNVNRLEGFLNAGSDAEAKRTIATIIEDLQEMNKVL